MKIVVREKAADDPDPTALNVGFASSVRSALFVYLT
jgi:hypothetical protein